MGSCVLSSFSSVTMLRGGRTFEKKGDAMNPWEGSIIRRNECAFDGIAVSSYKKRKPALAMVALSCDPSFLRLRKKDRELEAHSG